MSEPHLFAIRVYYEDTDASGIVYHANYLKFMERGRTEWLRGLGLDHQTLLARPDPLAFAVRRMSIEFQRPARIDDCLTVETQMTQVTGARLILMQRLCRQDMILAEASVEIVCFDAKGRPRRLPALLQTETPKVTPAH